MALPTGIFGPPSTVEELLDVVQGKRDVVAPSAIPSSVPGITPSTPTAPSPMEEILTSPESTLIEKVAATINIETGKDYTSTLESITGATPSTIKEVSIVTPILNPLSIPFYLETTVNKGGDIEQGFSLFTPPSIEENEVVLPLTTSPFQVAPVGGSGVSESDLQRVIDSWRESIQQNPFFVEGPTINIPGFTWPDFSGLGDAVKQLLLYAILGIGGIYILGKILGRKR